MVLLHQPLCIAQPLRIVSLDARGRGTLPAFKFGDTDGGAAEPGEDWAWCYVDEAML